MQSLRKPVRRSVRPADPRVRRVRTTVRSRFPDRQGGRLPDMSELVLYGQG